MKLNLYLLIKDLIIIIIHAGGGKVDIIIMKYEV